MKTESNLAAHAKPPNGSSPATAVDIAQKESTDHIPFIVTFHLHNPAVKSIILAHDAKHFLSFIT